MHGYALALADPRGSRPAGRPKCAHEKNIPATFSTTSQLVVETVNVKDKSGKPVLGLTAKDFTLTEDGVPQDIRFFEFQKVPEAAEPEPAITKPPAPFRTLPEAQITAERPGNLRYQDRRLMVFYFDLTAMPPQDQVRAVEAAKKFIRTQMTPADRVALMRFEGGAVRVMSDFTGDRDRLDSILETMIVGEAQGFDETAADDSAPDTGAAFGQDDSEFNIFNTNRQLSALQTAANMLAHVSEKKSLLYFASGLRLNGLDNHAQLQATTNAAIRAGVQIWPIDARGLVAEAPLGDATQGSPGGKGMYTGASALALTSRFQQSQDTLFALAADTGGKALLDNNDLSRGIVQAQNSVASYYLIGYYTTNANLDGKFRRIKISLNNGLSASLDYRQGYFAGKTFGKFTSAEKERQLEDALMLGDPITELTIAMEIDYFQLNRAEYFVPVVVKIPGRELALARKGGAERTLIDFIGEIKDDYGTTIQNVRDKADIKLSGESAARLAKQPIEYDTGFTLLPGKYRDQTAGARRGDRPHRHVRNAVCHSQSEQGAAADSYQLGGAEQPARGSQRCHLQRSQEQGSSRADESAGSGETKTDSERDAGVQQEPPDVRLSASLRTRRHRHTTAGCLRDVLSRFIEGLRNSAAFRHRGAEQSLEDAAAAVRSLSGSALRPVLTSAK